MKNQQHNHGSAWQAILLTWQFMNSIERRKVFYLSLISVFISLVDVIALIGVVPLVGLIIEPETMSKNQAVNQIYLIFGQPEYDDFVLIFALGAISLIALGVTLNLLFMWLTKRFRVNCQNRLARDLVSKCVGASYLWFLNQNSTTLTLHVSNDVLTWSSGGINSIVSIIGHISLLTLTSIIVINFANLSGLFGILIIGLVAILVMTMLRPKIKSLSQFRRTAQAKSISVAREFFSGIKDVKLSGRETTFIDRYLYTFNIYGEAMGKLKILQAIPPLAMLFIGQASIILIALVLWSSNLSSGQIASQVTLVLLVIARAVPVVTKLSGEFATLWNSTPSLNGIRQILDEVSQFSIDNDFTIDVKPIASWEKIILDKVSYQYELNKPMVLSKVSILIEKGKCYGVVGPTGSGKTTLIDLILGLLDPSEGTIFIDNYHLKKENRRGWQNMIGYVSQNPTIIDGTLLSNVCLGIRPDKIDRSFAIRCLKSADLNDVLNEVTLDGSLGEDGKWLSGGQRQRVCIARALYKKPKILILDEATSALDTLSENAIQQTLNNLDSNITIIMIAHRITTIQDCDEIFVLKDGQIADKGDYSFLINNSSLFKKLAKQ